DELIIFGPWIAQPVQAVMPLVKRHHAFTYAVSVSPSLLPKFRPNLVALYPDFQHAVKEPMKGWIKLNPDIKSVVIIYDTFDTMLKEFYQLQRAALEEIGVTVNAVQLTEGVDMGAAVIKAMAFKPDGYSGIGLPQKLAQVAQELKKRGMNEPRRIIWHGTCDDPSFFEIGRGAIDGSYMWNIFNRLSDQAGWVSFRNAFKAKFSGIEPVVVTPVFYDMVYLAKYAIEKGGLTGDPAKLKEERQKLIELMKDVPDFSGIQQVYDIVDYQAQAPAYLFRVLTDDIEVLEVYQTQ
ncbi:MAG: ABC transporter substrate-binding protein, partial [Deltaproteobacteria bacterium]|nr:ABC transporter substrate-binding protein [Deltaproteobacteria bacterium]